MGILRTFLAVCVIFEHSHPQWKIQFLNGEVAVQLFFIISGFYMSLILGSKYVGKNSYGLFITNRFLRIYPVYWAVLVLTVLVSIVSGLCCHNWLQFEPYISLHQNMGFTASALSEISNLAIFGQDLIMFLGLNAQNGALFFTENFRHINHAFYIFLFIPQAWTLGIELTFYLIAPFIVNKNIWLVLGLMTASLLLRAHIYRGLGWTWDPWTHRFFPTELFFFLLGNLSYRIYDRIKNREKSIQIGKYAALGFFLTLLVYPNIHFTVQQEISYVPYYFLAFISLPFIFNLTKNSRSDNRLGELSYPIYLVHILALLIVGLVVKAGSANLKTILTVALSAATAFVLLKLIIDPIERVRQARLTSKPAEPEHIEFPFMAEELVGSEK